MQRRRLSAGQRALCERLEDRKLLSLVVGLTAGNYLWTFDSANPIAVLDRQKVTGLAGADRLIGIDYRPQTGELYGVGRYDILYKINPITGAATRVGTANFAVGITDSASAGFDFNPVTDRARLVNTAEQNVRINPDTGEVVDAQAGLINPGVQADDNLRYVDFNADENPDIAGLAHANNRVNFGGSTAYAIDTRQDTLVYLGNQLDAQSPNSGQLRTAGFLGVNASGPAELDIITLNDTDIAYATLKVGGVTGFYGINLFTGAATRIGNIGDGTIDIVGLAITPPGKPLVALAADNRLVQVDTVRPDVATKVVRVGSGLTLGDALVAVDFRPTTGELYGLAQQGRIYKLDYNTGVAQRVGGTLSGFSGSNFGFDFNPQIDRIRLTSDSGMNWVINPDTGAIQTRGERPFYSGSSTLADVASVAYTNNRAGITGTTLYAVDASTDSLVRIGSHHGTPVGPNTGEVFSVGGLGRGVVSTGGFDIYTANDTDFALAALKTSATAKSELYTVDLITGLTTRIGQIWTGRRTIFGIAAIV